jgi:hypothetical protein
MLDHYFCFATIVGVLFIALNNYCTVTADGTTATKGVDLLLTQQTHL